MIGEVDTTLQTAERALVALAIDCKQWTEQLEGYGAVQDIAQSVTDSLVGVAHGVRRVRTSDVRAIAQNAVLGALVEDLSLVMGECQEWDGMAITDTQRRGVVALRRAVEQLRELLIVCLQTLREKDPSLN